jgi:hypothetical protein
VFIGFTPSDLEHLARLQPINIEGANIGVPGKQFVLMREDDPIIEMYLQFPIVVIRIRHELLETIQAKPAFVQVPLAGPGIADNTFAMFFFAPDDAGLIARLDETKLTSTTSVSGAPRNASWFAPILCSVIAVFLVVSPAFLHVESIGGLLAAASLFAVAAGWLFYSTAKARRPSLPS